MKILAILLILTSVAAISYADKLDKTLLFETPCTADEDKLLEHMPVEELANKLSDQAYTTLVMMEQFRDEYAQVLQNQDFDHLLISSKGKEWLRTFHWYQDEVLPREKEIGIPQDPEYLKRFHERSQEYLPKMHKALKMILGGLMEMKAHGFDTYDDNIVQYVKKYVDDSINSVKSVLCTFTKFMLSSDIDSILPLTQSEVPKITKENNGLLYRDTIHFLSYLSQVFQFIGEDIEKLICEVKTSLGMSCKPGWYGPEYQVDNDTGTYDVTIIPYSKETN